MVPQSPLTNLLSMFLISTTGQLTFEPKYLKLAFCSDKKSHLHLQTEMYVCNVPSNDWSLL